MTLFNYTTRSPDYYIQLVIMCDAEGSKQHQFCVVVGHVCHVTLVLEQKAARDTRALLKPVLLTPEVGGL